MRSNVKIVDSDGLPISLQCGSDRAVMLGCFWRVRKYLQAACEIIDYRQILSAARCAENLTVIDDFTSRLEVLPYTPKTAQHYGSIRAALERNGETIGVNDLHIAAHARSEGLVLVTNNLREFERVPALETENWISAVV